jgi:hypothetical protein
MAYTVPTIEPKKFAIGTTLKFKRSLPNYLPSTWTLSYALVMTGQQITFTASDNGDGTHLVNVDEATTAAWAAGIYRWQSYITDGTDKFAVNTGTIELTSDFDASTSGFDDRAHVKKVLDALEATILGKASKDQAFYMIAGRQISRTPVEDLIRWRNLYKSEYSRLQQEEDLARGLSGQHKIRTRFRCN